ncbi:MAG: carboxypeptidase [Rhizobium sp.]|nr:carboxypeptidase [Rhizobium sp.]
MTKSWPFAALFTVVALLAIPAAAQENMQPRQTNTVSAGIFSLLPADSVTNHVLKTARREMAYTATAGTLDLYGQDGTVTAKVFYTAYIARDRPSKRPLTFAFNGGPGAASAYLHLGLVGPKILDFGPESNDGTTPTLRDNPESWLDFTDLVVIDPVGTGWSRAASNDAATRFYGVKQDAETLAKIITLYVQHNDRLGAPKYLLGESYGGFRAAKVASALRDSQGILVSGIIMVSPLIDGRLLFGATDYPLGAALQLPSLAAAELERKNAFSTQALTKAEKFAMSDYLVALAGTPPAGAQADALYQRLSDLTGIPKNAITRTRGFLGDIYTKNVGDIAGAINSPYDASYAAPDPYPEAAYDRSDDPILDGFTRAYGAAFASYARNQLGFACEMTYNLLAQDINSQWDWNGNRADASASGNIRELLSTIPSFRLMVVHGYSDALTPYGASRYVLNHLPASLAKGRTELKMYRGGHMFYTQQDSRKSMTEDARKFYAGETSTE